MPTIGTASRDYSTISAWEADLSTGSQTGECYNDSVFDESFTISDADPSDITLTVAAGERHDGTAGTGVRIVRTTDSKIMQASIDANSQSLTIEWLELDGNLTVQEIAGLDVLGISTPGEFNVSRLLIHDTDRSGGSKFGLEITAPSTSSHMMVANSIIYDVGRDSGTGGAICYGVWANFASPTSKDVYFYNVTVHNTVSATNTNDVTAGIQFENDAAAQHCKNCLVTDTDSSGSGTVEDYGDVSDTTNKNNNLSSDATAPGVSSLTSKASADQFVSTVGGSEDLHLKSGADAIDAGADLGTTPTGVAIDIDGRDRDASGDVWDMGADERVSAVGQSGSLTLALELDETMAGTAQAVGSASFGVDQSQTQAGAAQAQAALALAADQTIGLLGEAAAGAGLSLDTVLDAAFSGLAAASASVGAGIDLAMQLSGTPTVLADLSFALDQDLATSGQAAAGGSAAFGHTLSLAVLADALAEAGLSVDNVLDIALVGDQVSVAVASGTRCIQVVMRNRTIETVNDRCIEVTARTRVIQARR